MWSHRNLGEITENLDAMRVPVKEADRRPGPYPYYGASGVVDHVDSYIFEGENLLIAEDGENLRTRQTPVAFLARGKYWVNNHAHIVCGNQLADTRFLMYALSRADISAYLTGSTMPKLTQANLNRIPVPLPPLPIQKRIAHILGTLDDKIELNRRMNETLEAMARAIFKSWFIDFDPVKRNMERNQPSPGLRPPSPTGRGAGDEDADALFPAEFQNSELGLIPKGWGVGTMRELMAVDREVLNPNEFSAEQFAHYSIPAFDERGAPIYERGASIMSNKFVVPRNSVLVSRLNPRIPRVWMPQIEGDGRAICSTEYLVCRPREGIGREFILMLISSRRFYDEFSSRATGTTGSHQRVKAEEMVEMWVTIPPRTAIEHFTAMVYPMLRQKQANIMTTEAISTLRDALLPKLLSGELAIPEAENAISEAT